MNRIAKFVFLDIFKNNIIIAYTVLLALLSWTVFSLEDSEHKGILTLLNLIILVVPLVSMLFSTIYIYNSSEFIELLVSQPVKRKQIWISLFTGLSGSLLFAFLIAAVPPLMLFSSFELGAMITAMGCLITLIFVSFAFLAAILSRDKAKGIGITIMIWLYLALMFDGLVMFLLFQLSEYPIEKPMVIISATNPLDLARILILLHLDSSAMLGYTGAIFKDYFGSTLGMTISFLILLIWAFLPFYYSLNLFKRKDL
jgi:Cu-processing system permease protein